MKSKTFILSAVSLVLVALLAVSGITIAIDPLFIYHKPWFGLEPVITSERYQNAGVAKNFDFDNVIIGNSMCENFKPSDFKNCFEGTTVKLTASGSHALDWTYLLKILKNKENQPKNIVMNFDDGILKASATETKHYLPTFLYDDNILNDVNYFFNFSILKDYTFKSVRANLKNDIPDIDTLFVWDHQVSKGKEFILSKYNRPDIVNTSPDIDAALNLAKENINLLIPYFESMKETDFTLFFSPFSIVYWDEQTRLNKIDLWKTAYSEICELLVEYDNVHLLCWTDDEMMNIITNLDNYKDTTHYISNVSLEIVDRISRQEGKLTKQNYIYEIEKFFDFISNYDYEQIFI